MPASAVAFNPAVKSAEADDKLAFGAVGAVDGLLPSKEAPRVFGSFRTERPATPQRNFEAAGFSPPRLTGRRQPGYMRPAHEESLPGRIAIPPNPA